MGENQVLNTSKFLVVQHGQGYLQKNGRHWNLKVNLVYFVGYPDHVKAYKLMGHETREIFFERSVHFEETCPSLAPSTPPSPSFMESDNSDDHDSKYDIPSTLTHGTLPL